MRNLALQAGHAIAWLTLGVLVAVAIFAVTPRAAEATPPISYLQPGLLDKNACYPWGEYPYPNHPCWHHANSGLNTAIDYNYYGGSCPPWGNNCTAGRSVYLYFTGSGLQWQPFKLFVISYCKGVEARIYQEGHVGDGNYYRGEARYLHMDPRSGVHGLVPSSNFTWLGWASSSEVGGCSWSGPNLHQDADVSYYTPFYTNWTGNHPYDYSHRIQW